MVFLALKGAEADSQGRSPPLGSRWSHHNARSPERGERTSAPLGRDRYHESGRPGAGRPWLWTSAPPGRDSTPIRSQTAKLFPAYSLAVLIGEESGNFSTACQSWKTPQRVPLRATFRAARHALAGRVSLRMLFQNRQIGPEASPPWRCRYLLALAPPKVPRLFPPRCDPPIVPFLTMPRDRPTRCTRRLAARPLPPQDHDAHDSPAQRRPEP